MSRLDRFKEQYVLVIGDLMIDKYVTGSVNRISPEAPVPVLKQEKVMRKLGGAGNVILNIISLGGKVRAIGRVGCDGEGDFLRSTLQEFGVDERFVYQEGNTIVKTRVAANNQQFIRIDEEIISTPSEKIFTEIQNKMESIMHGITVVILSDYAKGFITEELARIIIKAAKSRNIPVLVDPKGKSAAKYAGATALTPNNKEFLDFTGLSAVPCESEIQKEALNLCKNNDFEYLIYTRSEKGISIIDSKDGTKRDFPAVVKEVVDVTGAGDTVVSTIALAMGAGFILDECAKLANVAASIVVSKFGAAQVAFEELRNNFETQEKLGFHSWDEDKILECLIDLKKRGKKIVFTNGCFDLVHAGHISSFYQARKYGDILVVGLNSDESIRRIKGEKRPIVSLENRKALLDALSCVDYVLSFSEDTPQKLIERIKPDVLVKGKDWEGKKIAGDDFVWSYGGEVKFIELEQGLSTTSIIEKIKYSLE